MKHKTSELTGAMLDAAVAKAEGKTFGLMSLVGDLSQGITVQRSDADIDVYYSPSTVWNDGGPIIERERIDITSHGDGWSAGYGQAEYGQTPLIAAMRAYVASKLGDEVDL